MKRCAIVLTALGVVMFSIPVAHADSILNVTETVTASGSLDGKAFSDALLTLSATIGPPNVDLSRGVSGLFVSQAETAMISVAGVGSDTITGLIFVFANQNTGGAGFNENFEDILDTGNAAFDTYALSTAIGPTSGTPTFDSSALFPTGLGTFDITSVSGDATFTAVVGTPVTTPEPSSMLTLGTALVGLLSIRKRNAITTAKIR